VRASSTLTPKGPRATTAAPTSIVPLVRTKTCPVRASTATANGCGPVRVVRKIGDALRTLATDAASRRACVARTASPPTAVRQRQTRQTSKRVAGQSSWDLTRKNYERAAAGYLAAAGRAGDGRLLNTFLVIATHQRTHYDPEMIIFVEQGRMPRHVHPITSRVDRRRQRPPVALGKSEDRTFAFIR